MSTSSDLKYREDIPSLQDPVLLLAWEGWNDAGESASTAARYLIQQLGTGPIAHIDAEEFYDFTEARPMARYRGGNRYIAWPETEFVQLQPRPGERDIVVGLGVEPHFRWKRYMGALSELVDNIGVKLILSMGSVAANTLHTQPVRVGGSANNSALAHRYNMHPSRFEGPSGIVGVFHDHCRRRDVGGVSLWASVPHYLPGLTNPVGAEALLRVVSDMTGLHLDFSPLEQGVQQFHAQLDELLRDNEELRDYVSRLERMVQPPANPEPESELPSADALIADLEDFFRQGGGDGGSGGGRD